MSVTLGLFAWGGMYQAQAQTFGALTGTVSDSSSAVIPSASIHVLQKTTGIVTGATTNDQGLYRFAVLVPGEYEVTVSRPGFRDAKTEVSIVVTETAILDMKLVPETAPQTVTVTGAESPLLQTESSTLGVSSTIAPCRRFPWQLGTLRSYWFFTWNSGSFERRNCVGAWHLDEQHRWPKSDIECADH